MTTPARTLLFISHANPEDNHFSLWLSLKLAREGYRVWCDLTRLLGGEDFWADIEEAIRTQAVKLIYVLSPSSNRKRGPLQELQVGLSTASTHKLKDFVIPLRIDNIPYDDINIQLVRLNAIDFTQGWARGLSTLLEKLELDGVEKDPRFSPNSVTTWWQNFGSPSISIVETPEEHLSNWFPIRRLPEAIFLHSITTTNKRVFDSRGFPYPTRQLQHLLVSFACADDLRHKMPVGVRIIYSHEVSLDEFMKGIVQPTLLMKRNAHNIVVDLLRQGWERFTASVGLSRHYLAQRSVVVFLREGQVDRNVVSVPREYGVSRRRAVVGYRSRKDSQGNVAGRRFWHFAIAARPAIDTFIGYKLIPHLLFSDDGRNIWQKSARSHSARRSESRNWWNPEWRDRTLGLVNWLAGNEQYFEVELGSKAVIQVERRPIHFISPVSYVDPASQQAHAPDSVDFPGSPEPEEDTE